MRCVGACLNSSYVFGTFRRHGENTLGADLCRNHQSAAKRCLLLDGALQGSVHDIIWQLRLPRIVLAAAVGAGLASSGVIMQAIVKNPLADPYILGISSGASLGATAAILLGIGAFMGENFIGLAAFAGAFAISLLVLFISNLGGRSNSVKLLLAGMVCMPSLLFGKVKL